MLAGRLTGSGRLSRSANARRHDGVLGSNFTGVVGRGPVPVPNDKGLAHLKSRVLTLIPSPTRRSGMKISRGLRPRPR
jgi:hypothetical protein